MSVYKVMNKVSPLDSVEFSPVAEGNFAFFSVDAPANTETVKKWLTSSEMGQKIIADTMVDGHPVLVTQGEKTKEDIMKILDERGDTLELEAHKKPFNFWALRGGMSIVGQTMQLTSALIGVEKLAGNSPKLQPNNPHYNPNLKEGMHVRKPFAADIGMFAILNLIANAANIAYGGQKEKGDNRLRHVKGMLNEELGEHLAIGDTPIGINDNRAQLRDDSKDPPGAMEKLDKFARENSVRFFEIGLRFAAAVALVIPFKKAGIKAGMEQLGKGNVAGAWKAAKNPVELTRLSGLGYLTGKTIALFTKVPDPYSDKPHTFVDTVREDYLFKLGGLIEAAAGYGIMVNAYKTKKIGLSSSDKPDITPHRDWLGTVGGALFAGGYIVRMGAKFGERNVDMNEIYAHATDTLAKTPADQMPQLMADTAASLKNHFKDKPVEFGEIFTRMMNDMYRYHHIALNNVNATPAEQTAKTVEEPAKDATKDATESATAKYTLANAPRRPVERTAIPSGSFVDKVAQSSDLPATSQGISV